jgi:hypothetical protein
MQESKFCMHAVRIPVNPISEFSESCMRMNPAAARRPAGRDD